MFKVGDKVVSVAYGDGVVVYIDEDKTYPLNVYFNNGEDEEFSLDGKERHYHTYPTLFHADGYKSPVPGKHSRKPGFDHDEVILVREGGDWRPRHFKEWNGNLAMCYVDGKSSKTTGCYTGWDQYKKYEGK